MSDGQVKKYFVILRDVGCVPEKKGSWPTSKMATDFIREVTSCRPATTEIALVQLTWDDDIWVSDGREYIAMDDAVASMTDEDWAALSREEV
jgi:hypothetical protein